ncbi:outer membrane beta-barrel protein [Flavobacterium franklandianum]|uniref:Porin family protein n=1 Tax=Flavobacterium franklandianum TaxID=2594430 RepID=A0A553C7D0_9FLAO|nr:outer membrane beta-barrel protein [Flavobacterium franklandianum]TRX16428.1 porin family protein [Flavobacterium franklandianum]
MKTIKIFFITTILFTLSAHSQITKGNWMVGGNGSFSNKEFYNNSFKNDKLKTSELSINANVGYFIIDKLQAGVRVGYNDSKIKNGISDDGDRYWVKYGAYTRYYFLKPEKLVNIYLDGEYFFGNNAFSSGQYKERQDGYSVSLGPTIFFNSSVAMELGINYSSAKFRVLNDATQNNLQFTIGFQIFLEKE